MDGTGVDQYGTRLIFQYHGCYWHGHHCYKNKKRTEVLDIRHEYTRTMDAKLDSLSKNPVSPYGSFEYVTIYECKFMKLLKENQEMKSYVRKFIRLFPTEANQQLSPRNGMRGGRTNAIKHNVIVDIQRGFRLFYLDYTRYIIS